MSQLTSWWVIFNLVYNCDCSLVYSNNSRLLILRWQHVNYIFFINALLLVNGKHISAQHVLITFLRNKVLNMTHMSPRIQNTQSVLVLTPNAKARFV